MHLFLCIYVCELSWHCLFVYLCISLCVSLFLSISMCMRMSISMSVYVSVCYCLCVCICLLIYEYMFCSQWITYNSYLSYKELIDNSPFQVYVIYDLIKYCRQVCLEICEHLNIMLFTIIPKYPQTKATSSMEKNGSSSKYMTRSKSKVKNNWKLLK